MPLSGGPRVQSLMLTLIACLFAGCTSEPLISRQALVGNYVYKSQDPEGKASDHEWDRLTLEVDGKYDLVQGGPTKTKSEKTGSWSVVFYGGAIMTFIAALMAAGLIKMPLPHKPRTSSLDAVEVQGQAARG